MKQKLIYILLTIAIIIAVTGVTYAFVSTKQSTSNEDLIKSGKLEINYTGQIMSSKLIPSLNKDKGLYAKVTMNLATDSLGAPVMLYLTPTTLPTALKISALKWEVYVNDATEPLTTGDFSTATANTAIQLLDTGYTLTTTATIFHIYVWLDGALTGNEVANQTFEAKINASVTNLVGEVD